MRKPQVDYRQFRFSKLNTPQFSHLKLLLGWVGYFNLSFHYVHKATFGGRLLCGFAGVSAC